MSDKNLIPEKLLPTSLRSKQIRYYFSDAMKDEALFSARTTATHYLERVRETLQKYMDGVEDFEGTKVSYGKADARADLTQELEQLGILTPTADEGGPITRIQNLASQMRINLVLETNQAQAHSKAQEVLNKDPVIQATYPAWELVRDLYKKEPRDWDKRWLECANAVNWEGVSKDTSRKIALVNSPIWHALGHRYKDCLGTSRPPFCFQSGMGWERIDREEAKEAGLIDGD